MDKTVALDPKCPLKLALSCSTQTGCLAASSPVLLVWPDVSETGACIYPGGGAAGERAALTLRVQEAPLATGITATGLQQQCRTCLEELSPKNLASPLLCPG